MTLGRGWPESKLNTNPFRKKNKKAKVKVVKEPVENDEDKGFHLMLQKIERRKKLGFTP